MDRIKNKVLNQKTIESNQFDHHVKASEVKQSIPKKMYDSYFKFGFVRNPWDWQVSMYYFTQQNPEHFQHELVKKMTFDEYIEWRVSEAMCYQKEFLFDEKGKQIVDFIGKIETIDKDFEFICNQIGIKNTLPHTNKSKHQDYKVLYNSQTKKMIEDAYKEEIELFDYSFD